MTSRIDWNAFFAEADKKEIERLKANISKELEKPEGQRNERLLAKWQYKLDFYQG